MRVLLLTTLMVLSFAVSSQTIIFKEAQEQAKADIKKFETNCHYEATRNIYIDNKDVIHVFIFEDGNLLLAGYPTTATEKDKFQIHLYLSKDITDKYLLEYTGSYTPIFNIGNESTLALLKSGEVKSMDFAIIGPFTKSLQITVKRLPKNSTEYITLTSTTIQISKTIHASIGGGLIYSTLKNPSNIRKVPILSTSSDSTLIADDINGRGLVTLFATYYPWGRNNLMIPDWNFKDRFGILIGTSIGASTSSFKDFFIGAEYDFSIGGSIVSGLHYGRRQRIYGVDYKSFHFGETKFSGNLDDKKYFGWNIGFFIGVQVDSRIFSQIFK